MRKFLSVIAFAVLAVGLIIGGVVIAAELGKLPEGTDLVAENGTQLGLCIGLFAGGVASAIATIANFFTARTRDK